MTGRGEQRRLVVTGCRQVAAGQGDHGDWRLHEITATTIDGKPIRARLVSFDAFEAGEVDVLVERQEHPDHGASYLLRRPRAALAGRVATLERQLRQLADRVERLEERA